MLPSKNFDIFLYEVEKGSRFFLGQNAKLYCTHSSSEEPVPIYSGKIVEFDMDVDSQGNVGIIILDETGKLIYKYSDGDIWNSYLLYQLKLGAEEFRHVSIRFLIDSPYIMVCWRDLSVPHSWSILCYYREGEHWEKRLFNRIFFRDEMKPYFFTRDNHSHLHLIYLKNYNMFYHIMYTRFLSLEKKQWSDSIRISDCIYSKSYQSDILIDSNGIVHISWIDKHKKKYCVKYISVDTQTNKYSELEYLFEDSFPIIRQQLFLKDERIHCHVLTTQGIFAANRNSELGWSIYPIPEIDTRNIQLVKWIPISGQSSSQYLANYIFLDNHSSLSPFILSNKPFSKSSNDNPDTLEPLQIKKDEENILSNPSEKVNFQNYKIKQELESKNQLIRSLQEQNAFLYAEIERLNAENKKYLSIIEENSERNKMNYENMKNYEKLLNQLEELKSQNQKMQAQIEFYESELDTKKQDIEQLQNENIFLKEQAKKIKDRNLWQRLFNK
jgi:uncharacterized small protein (DUF1192 family)